MNVIVLVSSNCCYNHRLHTVPNSSLGLRVDNGTVRVAVVLSLVVALRTSHSCQQYAATIDKVWTSCS